MSVWGSAPDPAGGAYSAPPDPPSWNWLGSRRVPTENFWSNPPFQNPGYGPEDCCIQPSDVVRDLGVLLDNTLSMTNHISTVTKSCFFHLRRIRQIERCFNEKCLRTLVQALVISRFDYCNSIMINLPDTTLHQSSIFHKPLSSTVLHDSSKAWSQGITSPQLFGNYSTGFPSKREFHSKSVSSCSTSIPGHIRVHVILGHTVHNSRIEIESPLICQRRLRNPAHVQLIWSTSVRRCWSIQVEQSTCHHPSRAIYRIFQNQTKNSSFSNLLRITRTLTLEPHTACRKGDWGLEFKIK